MTERHPHTTMLTRAHWDVLVIGGGIVGAGVFREAARAGLNVLLVEKGDFASGTSSRSSKLIHGGLHYLARGQVRLSLRSRRERDRMLQGGTGLVQRLRFRFPRPFVDSMPPWTRRLLLAVYDPGTRREGPRNGSATPDLCYTDAQTDDVRLVLRVLREGRAQGGVAVNYLRVDRLLQDETGRPVGALATDLRSGRRATLLARVIVNATGFWADTLVQPGPAMGRTRGLRGSHLVFPRACLPLRSAVASVHADTGRPVYALPWGPVTLVGSTSIPHTSGPDTEPVISEAEVEYLLRWTQTTFPDRRIDVHDIRSTFSGVRAMAGQPGGKELAHASREEHIGRGPGLVTVIGGKLTTFHSTARRVMSHVRRELGLPRSHSSSQPLDPLPVPWPGLPFSDPEARRLMAFYGPSALEALAGARPADRKPLPGLNVCAAEIRWVCARESVERLGDLMLRRFRWGLTAPLGGLPSIPRLRGIVCPAMGWSATRWQHEVQAYRTYWRHAHAPPSIQGSAPVGESRRRARKQVASA